MKWHAITKNKRPETGYPYLVRTIQVGAVYDVAFYHGRRSDGSDWWILTNVEIPASSITHYAEIEEPNVQQL